MELSCAEMRFVLVPIDLARLLLLPLRADSVFLEASPGLEHQLIAVFFLQFSQVCCVNWAFLSWR